MEETYTKNEWQQITQKYFKLQTWREKKYRKITNEMGRWFPGGRNRTKSLSLIVDDDDNDYRLCDVMLEKVLDFQKKLMFLIHRKTLMHTSDISHWKNINVFFNWTPLRSSEEKGSGKMVPIFHSLLCAPSDSILRLPYQKPAITSDSSPISNNWVGNYWTFIAVLQVQEWISFYRWSQS